MKKIIKYIFILCIIIISATFCIPNKVKGICNTIRFSKDLTAVQLILNDGTILYDIKINEASTEPSSLTSINYKNLNLVFIVETENGLMQNKTAISNFIEGIYQLYSTAEDKIKIGIIPFNDLSQDEANARTQGQKPDIEQEIWKNTKKDAKDEVVKLKNENKQTLEEALLITQNNVVSNRGGTNNGEIVQQVVIITDGIDNENVASASNTILKDLGGNMIAMYGIFIEATQKSNDNLAKLSKGVSELRVAEGIKREDVEYQLENDVSQYIQEFMVREFTLLPSGGNENTLITGDSIILFVDEEILHGAKVKAEYKFSVSRYAYYGDGTINSNKILDNKDPKMRFDENETLLTDTSKKNSDYEWKQTEEGLVTECKEPDVRLVLSTIVTPQGMDEGVYSNSALCNTNFNNGDDSTASYSLSAKSMDIKLMPPFGKETTKKDEIKWIIYTITGLSIIVLLGLFIVIKKSNKKR